MSAGTADPHRRISLPRDLTSTGRPGRFDAIETLGCRDRENTVSTRRTRCCWGRTNPATTKLDALAAARLSGPETCESSAKGAGHGTAVDVERSDRDQPERFARAVRASQAATRLLSVSAFAGSWRVEELAGRRDVTGFAGKRPDGVLECPLLG